MRFISLKLTNFKPYHGDQEIVLFNRDKGKKSITLNVGPTGHGKTSISEAIMWCLSGEGYNGDPRWEKWVNDLSVEVAKEKRESEVRMAVELVVEIEDDLFRIIRSGTIDVKEKEKIKNMSLETLKNGSPTKEEPRTWIEKHFVPINLMEYFIFDADDMLNLFQQNQEKTIRTHINKLLRVEVLDKMVETLNDVTGLYDDEISEIQSDIPGEISEKMKSKRRDLQKKKLAILGTKKTVKRLEGEKKKLFPKSPSGRLKRFSDLVDNRDQLEEKIKNLNTKFKEETPKEKVYLPSEIHLLFLKDVINESLDSLKKRKPTRNEFETSINVIRSTVEKKYSGIVFREQEAISLIKDSRRIDKKNLDEIGTLEFSRGGSGIRIDEMKVFGIYGRQIENLSILFSRFRNEFVEKMNALVKLRVDIRQIGDTEENKELKKKFDRFHEFEGEIIGKKRLIKKIEGAKEEIEEEIRELREELKLKEEQEERIKLLESKEKKVEKMLKIVEKTKTDFMNNLLTEVNKSASRFLRETVKDKNRFYSLQVHSDYRLDIKKKNGQVLGEERVNRGNLQIALMAFFFGISKHLGKDLPYVIDAPLIRLDPGHDKRLLTHLGDEEKQIIMHLIPGKEYSPESFKWLHPYINVQNWIFRKEFRKSGMYTSQTQSMDPNNFIEYNIDDF